MDEQQEEEPLFSDRMMGLLQYQLQQHVQLLAQSYVLTATSNDEPMKKLTEKSRAMIVHLNNLADIYGSISAVKNLSHSNILINSWPVNATKSPIENKILEERYLNESKIEADGKLFPRNVVKVISESAVCMYGDLLPLCGSLHLTTNLNFTPSEHALLLIGVREMESEEYENLTLCEKSRRIKNWLLPARSASQIYRRINNTRNTVDGNETVTVNYINQTFPPTASWTPAVLELEPTPPIRQIKLHPTWHVLFAKLMYSEHIEDLISISHDKKSFSI